MGNKASGDAKLSKRLSMKLSNAQRKDQQSLKLLLLGAGESGKSTIFKQMKLLYGKGFTAQERSKMRPFLVGNIIEGAIDIYEAASLLDMPIKDDKIKSAGEFLKNLSDKRNFTDDVVSAINTLWGSEEYRAVWEKRSNFQLQESWHELVNCLQDYPAWGGPEWVPTTDEILQCRVRTTGVVDEEFLVKGVKLRMLDVGGQRNERRKWIHCFEGVTSVLFVASLSEYDQMLFEDSTKNRLLESLELFDEISNSKWFTESAIVLFLNKTDLFEEKFLNRQIPLNASGLFPSAPAEYDKKIAYAWFEKMFKSQCKDKKRLIYAHFTCATDTQAIDAVMKASSQHILKQNLERSGVMV